MGSDSPDSIRGHEAVTAAALGCVELMVHRTQVVLAGLLVLRLALSPRQTAGAEPNCLPRPTPKNS